MHRWRDPDTDIVHEVYYVNDWTRPNINKIEKHLRCGIVVRLDEAGDIKSSGLVKRPWVTTRDTMTCIECAAMIARGDVDDPT